jgi:hypothetical protein
MAPAGARAAGVTKEQLDEVVTKLEANAQLWLKDEEVPGPQRVDVNKISFTKESVPHLEAILKSPKRDTARLYAVGKLLVRLQSASAETIQAALPAVKKLHTRTKNTYRAFPRFNPSVLASLKMPPYSRRMTTDAIMTRMAMLDRQRDVKVTRELPFAKHNEAVYGLESSTYRLMFLAGDVREDSNLAKALFLEERKGSAIFLDIADTIARNAGKMGPQRAQKLYPVFRPHLSRLAMQNKRKYTNRGKANLRRTEASLFEQKDEFAGIKVLETYNKIVEAAKLKTLRKVTVPSRKQIEEYHKKRKARRK